jgi:hypothetical protein
LVIVVRKWCDNRSDSSDSSDVVRCYRVRGKAG